MLSGRLLPAHPKPLPDELLSSWIVRIAEANGVKLHTLSRLLFGSHQRSVWLRDIGRLAPDWVLSKITRATGTPMSEVLKTTLNGYQGVLFPDRRLSGQLRWILPIKAWSAKRKGFGVQYCPMCLAEDSQPYFRRRWRIAFYTFCPKHNVMMYDACHFCGEPIAFHRRDFAQDIETAGTIAHCHACGNDLREAITLPVKASNPEAHAHHASMLHEFSPETKTTFDMGYYAVFHQLCRVLVSRSNDGMLARYVEGQIGCIPQFKQIVCPTRWGIFESLRVSERHWIALLAIWLLMGAENRLEDAWRAKAVRFNLLVKDFEDAPEWYIKLVWRYNRFH